MDHYILIECNLETLNSNCHHLPLEGSLKGSARLLAACKTGNLEAVKRKARCWEDIQHTAAYRYKFKQRKSGSEEIGVVGATPLFVAAIHGHASIVRYLLEIGADVSARTNGIGPLTGLTPLYAALIATQLEKRAAFAWQELKEVINLLVECGADPSDPASKGAPIWSLPLCNNVEAITTLIEVGMSLTLRHPIDGSTVLLKWIGQKNILKNGTLDFIQPLLEKSSDLKARDEDGFTPTLLAAVVINNFQSSSGNQTDATQDFAIQKKLNASILNFLLEREEVDRMERINAMELAGAVILFLHGELQFRGPPSKLHRIHDMNVGFEYWHRALQLRLSCTGECESILMTPSLNENNGLPNECNTLNELQELETQPSLWFLHASLMQLRILSSISSMAVARYMWPSVKDYFLYPELRKSCATRNFPIYKLILEICLRALGAFSIHSSQSPPVEFLTIFDYLQITCDNIVNHMDRKKDTADTFYAEEKWLLTKILKLTLKAMYEMPSECIKRGSRIISILAENCSGIDDQEILEYLSRIFRTEHGNILLPIVFRTNFSINVILRYRGKESNLAFATVRLLLQAGADPDVVDHNGDNPLHILLDSRLQIDAIDSVARLLVDAGANLDRVNHRGRTVASMWYERFGNLENQRQEIRQEFADLPDWCRRNVPTLMCLSARIIRRRRVPYINKLPVSLQAFVQMR